MRGSLLLLVLYDTKIHLMFGMMVEKWSPFKKKKNEDNLYSGTIQILREKIVSLFGGTKCVVSFK